MTWVPKDFLSGLKIMVWNNPSPSFSAFSQIFPIGSNIYEDYDHLYIMTLKPLFHS